MTTVVYHNNILASDGLGTITQAGHNAMCVHCEKPSESTAWVTKIYTDFKDILFRGDKVLAVGQAGNYNDGKSAIGILRSGKSLEEAHSAMEAFRPRINVDTYTLLIVGEKNVYMVEPEGGELVVVKHERDATVSTGSGQTTARFAVEHLNCDALMAVSAAIASDKYTAGTISWINCSEVIAPGEKFLTVNVLKEPDVKAFCAKLKERTTGLFTVAIGTPPAPTPAPDTPIVIPFTRKPRATSKATHPKTNGRQAIKHPVKPQV